MKTKHPRHARTELHQLVDRALGSDSDFARVYRLPVPAARAARERLVGDIADCLASQGPSVIELRKLLRKAVRVDRLRRFARSAVVSLLGSAPVGMAAAAGAAMGCAVGGPAGGLIGAVVGGAAGTLCAAPAAAASATALYELDARHRQCHPEFTLRVPASDGRARNAAAYAGGGLAANSPFIAGPALAAGLSSWGTTAAAGLTWGVGALAAAPLVSVAGAGIRVALQERLQRRVAGPLLGVTQDHESSAPRFDADRMQKQFRRLKPSTCRLVLRDLRTFCRLVRKEFCKEFRRAWQKRHGLKQTLLNAAVMTGAQFMGLGTGAAATLGGLAGGFAAPLQRTAAASVGQAAWGATRPRAGPGPARPAGAACGASAGTGIPVMQP